ncbi:hypothetical protein RBWH47_05970 [Rhodopirellula baltica WH47]|uniref:Uncharacterized protein n=1 Tax=Rhodopirellula baltica WH47 TaxID=991778 RepID=F2B2A2_RHOBT|nr:hypothetical protein RBWH47_05970 [Rhodopirellula baltica WH47]
MLYVPESVDFFRSLRPRADGKNELATSPRISGRSLQFGIDESRFC